MGSIEDQQPTGGYLKSFTCLLIPAGPFAFPRTMNRKSRQKKNVLIYRLGSLGDTIVALPCFHRIRRSFPDAFITLLTNMPTDGRAAAAEQILGSGGLVNDFVSYPVGTRIPGKLLRLVRAIRKHEVRTMVYLAAPRGKAAVLRDRLFFHFCGIRAIHGLPVSDRDFRVMVDPHTRLYEHESLRLSRRINSLGPVDLQDRGMWDLLLDPVEIASGQSITGEFRGRPYVAVSLGTKMQSKDWGVDNWKSLLEELSGKTPDHGLLLLGSGEEFDVSSRASTGWTGKVVNLCGNANPREVSAALRHAAVFIGHDSGPMHLAAATGVRCVAVFSSRGLPGQWFPHGAGHHVIYHQTDCQGCNLTVCVAQGKKCILSISVREVLDATLAVLNRTATSITP